MRVSGRQQQHNAVVAGAGHVLPSACAGSMCGWLPPLHGSVAVCSKALAAHPTESHQVPAPHTQPRHPRTPTAGRKLIEYTGAQVFEAPIHIEGGSIHSDGEG